MGVHLATGGPARDCGWYGQLSSTPVRDQRADAGLERADNRRKYRTPAPRGSRTLGSCATCRPFRCGVCSLCLEVNRIFRWASDSPGIVYRADMLVVRHFEDAELSILWTEYGRSASLYRIAHLAQPKKEDTGGLLYWETRSRSLGGRINAAKFLALWAITLFVAESIIAGHAAALAIRLALILSLWFLSAIVLLALFLYSVDQQATAAVFVLHQFILPKLQQGDDLRKLSAADREYAKSLRGATWWNLEVSGWRYLSWAYANVFRR